MEVLFICVLTLLRPPNLLSSPYDSFKLIPHLKPVRHQSTNSIVRLFFSKLNAFTASFGTTPPLYNRLQAKYFPLPGSQVDITMLLSKARSVNFYIILSYPGFSFTYDDCTRLRREYGTRFVWISLREELIEDSKRRAEVTEDTD